MTGQIAGETSTLVLMSLTREITLALINTDALGWRFRGWYGRRIDALQIQPDISDQSRRFEDAASALEYFRERYSTRLGALPPIAREDLTTTVG